MHSKVHFYDFVKSCDVGQQKLYANKINFQEKISAKVSNFLRVLDELCRILTSRALFLNRIYIDFEKVYFYGTIIFTEKSKLFLKNSIIY